MLKQRKQHSQYHILVEELRLYDREYFFKYLRMSPERLQRLVELVAPFIAKKKCRSRETLSPAERLVVTIRYLATGDSQQSQTFNFRLGNSTVCNIVRQTCQGIWDALNESFLKPPKTAGEWKKIAQGMFDDWDFPNCLGALDGKHIAIECPPNSGSEFYNYKKFFSIVLMAMCDSKYCFTLIDLGANGRENDAHIFNNSDMCRAIVNNELDIPGSSFIRGHKLPYVIVSDEIFGLKPWLMKPYGGNGLLQEEEIFNYRLSRCRRTIENTFGILCARWRIFRRPIRAKPETVDVIVKACVCLHNYLRLTYNAHYVPVGFVDHQHDNGDIIPGDWRQMTVEDTGAMQALRVGRAHNRYSFDANAVRKKFKDYFVSREGTVPWQTKHVTSVGEQLPVPEAIEIEQE
jgi:hypothetical protein